MKPEEILSAIKKSRELAVANPRNFKQTFDLVVTLQELDMKKPESKVKLEVHLPHGRGKPIRYGAIADGELAEKAKKAGLAVVIGRADLQSLAKDKKALRRVIKQVDIFIAQPDLMVDVGKTLGATLGPRDKMPKPVNPKEDLKVVFARFDKMMTARVKDQPIIHCPVGTEQMTDQQVLENTEKILIALKEKLPKGESQIKTVFLKMTMGPSVKVGAAETAQKAAAAAEAKAQ